jgi:hypothetical protein
VKFPDPVKAIPVDPARTVVAPIPVKVPIEMSDVPVPAPMLIVCVLEVLFPAESMLIVFAEVELPSVIVPVCP